MLSVIMLNVVEPLMLGVIIRSIAMLDAVEPLMLGVVIRSVAMLNVSARQNYMP
jgi:hypothetical protein